MKKSLRPLGLALYFLLCFAMAYVFIFLAFDSHKVAIITLVIATAAILVSVVLNTLTHELGHLIFGLLTGYHFLSFRIFCVMLVRENGTLKFRKHSMPGTLGQCLMAPPAYNGEDFPFMLYNLGGIIFGGLVSLLLVLAALLKEMHLTLQFFCLMTGWIGLILNFVNAIPQSNKKAMNDGTNTYYAKKSLAAKTALWNQLQYVSLNAKGFRTKDMPDTLFSLPPAEELDNPLTVWQGIASLKRACDIKDFPRAKEICTYLLETAHIEIPLYRAILISEALYLELILENEEKQVEEYYEEMKRYAPLLKRTISIHRVLYTYHLLHRRSPDTARSVISSFYSVIGKYPYRTDIESEGELISHAKEIYLTRENAKDTARAPSATPGSPTVLIEETSEEEENYIAQEPTNE